MVPNHVSFNFVYGLILVHTVQRVYMYRDCMCTESSCVQLYNMYPIIVQILNLSISILTIDASKLTFKSFINVI